MDFSFLRLYQQHFESQLQLRINTHLKNSEASSFCEESLHARDAPIIIIDSLHARDAPMGTLNVRDTLIVIIVFANY